jgi:putative oxidoreductase
MTAPVRAALLIARLALGALFVVAGILKLRDASAFATDIANYQLFPQMAALVAAVLPWTEIVAGVVLLVHPVATWRRAAALCIAAMMVVFTAAAGTAVARGLDVSCGCFGSESSPLTAWTLVRDVLLLAAAVALVVVSPAVPTRRAPTTAR